MSERYFCVKCDTIHSHLHDFFEKHRVYAIYPEEFGYPTVRELRQISKHLKTLADEVVFRLAEFQPGIYELYISSPSFRSVIFARLKAKIKGKPTFVERYDPERGLMLVNEGLGLGFVLVDKLTRRPDGCLRINGFDVCWVRLAVLKRAEEEREERLRERVRDLASEVVKYENLAYLLGYDHRLSREEYETTIKLLRDFETPIDKKDLEILATALRKLKRMVARRIHILNLLNELVEGFEPETFVSRATYYLTTNFGFSEESAKKIVVRFVYVRLLLSEPKRAVSPYFVAKEVGMSAKVVKKLLYPWSIFVRMRVERTVEKLKKERKKRKTKEKV